MGGGQEANIEPEVWVKIRIAEKFRKIIVRGINALAGKAAGFLYAPGKPKSPLADRLLADALRLAEIPSPTGKEEQRASFVLERLTALGLSPLVDEQGSILARVHSADLANLPPLLLFTNLGSDRWHPLESLSRLDAEKAWGAGLADSLGTAALISAAEGIRAGRIETSREIILLFAAGSFDTGDGAGGGGGFFLPVTGEEVNRPAAAIGVRGLTLGTLVNNSRGIYRMKIGFSREAGTPGKGDAGEGKPRKADAPVPGSAGKPSAGSGPVVDTLLDTAHKLAGITWDTGGTTKLYIRRIVAETTFAHVPQEGLLEIEIESSDGARLEMAMNTVKATVENAASGTELKKEVNITSFIPVGDVSVNDKLVQTVTGIMKDLRVKAQEEDGADIAAHLSAQGIPAVSLGIAGGREGLTRDTIEIDSIEQGRVLLETLINRLIREEA
jgi:acetylornithine deacetylase/succinyl-diaminopimelate desuccinylase-like protein